VGGSISGLTAAGLVLLNNAADATTIAANATSFVMHTAVAPGSTYSITVGTQPYGINLACTANAATGSVGGNITTVAIICTPVTPTQQAIKSFFFEPAGVAVDANGNLFVMDSNFGVIREIPYRNGEYGTPVTVVYGLVAPADLALDAQGNIYVAVPYYTNEVLKIPFTGGSYGEPTVVVAGLGIPMFKSATYGPSQVAVDGAGNVYAADTNLGPIIKVPYNNGVYGAAVAIGGGLSGPICVDANGDVFVVDTGTVEEIPFSNASYGTPVSLAGGFTTATGVAVDANGNVFVSEQADIQEIPYVNGSYAAPVSVATGFTSASNLVADSQDDVFVIDRNGVEPIAEVPYVSGSYGQPVGLVSRLYQPGGVATDQDGNVFVAESNGANDLPFAIEEIAKINGGYAEPAVLPENSAIGGARGVALDANRNLYFAEDTGIAMIPYSNGSYGTGEEISALDYPETVAVANGDIFAGDQGLGVSEINFVNGQYSSLTIIPSAACGSCGVAVDATGNLFVANADTNEVLEFPLSNGSYAAPVTIGSGFSTPVWVAVDANENVFVSESAGAVKEIPYGNGSYGAAVGIRSGIYYPTAIAVDSQGRLYVIDFGNIWMLAPQP
jgi:sugar lactone lactonase YvrE